MRLPHIPHAIIYTKNTTTLKNKRKSNDVIYLIAGVHCNKYANRLYFLTPMKASEYVSICKFLLKHQSFLYLSYAM